MIHSNTTISSKPPTPAVANSKSSILNWVKSIVPETPHNMKVQDLGNGVIFCKIINVYFANIIPHAKIISNPRNQYQNTSNLKQFQNALFQLKINIPMDVGKVSKMKFLENWALINSLYKHLNGQDAENSQCNDDTRSVHGQSFGGKTPKRTFENAFGNQESYFKGHKELKKDLFNSKQPLMPSIHFKDMNSGNFYFPQPPIPQHHFYNPYSQPNLNSFHNQMPSFNQNMDNKLKENSQVHTSPMKGKWSVNSHFFQTNHHAIIDRVKEILLKSSNDTQKIRQLKMLLNIPLDQDIVKIQEQQLLGNCTINLGKKKQHNTQNKQGKDLVTPAKINQKNQKRDVSGVKSCRK